MFTNLW